MRGSVPVARFELHEELETIQARAHHRRHTVDLLERTRDDDRCGLVEDALELLIDRGADDDVGHARLVLEREEHVALRGLGMLLHNDRATHAYELAVAATLQLDRR